MDAVRLGRSVRALRIRRGWRQVDLVTAAGVSQSIVSRLERGFGDRLAGRTLGRIAAALDARLVVRLDWNGEALDRLLDAGHAALVDDVVAVLRRSGWEVIPEATFAIAGERGSVDVLAWHSASGTLLIVEVKSVVPDVQATLAAHDRKVRLAPQIAASHGWRPIRVARLLVIGESMTSRRRVAAHAATFEARFPDRVQVIRQFVESPGSMPGRPPFGPSGMPCVLNGLWFLSPRTGATGRHRVPGRARCRRV